MNTATASTATALRDLDRALARPQMRGRAMDLHGVQGLSAALALGPRMVSPALWMSWVWDREQGHRPTDFADLDDANRVLAALMVTYNDVVAKLGPAADTGAHFDPAFLLAGPDAVVSFCSGFRQGMALMPDDWLPLRAEQPDWIALLEGPPPTRHK
jgi:yecA family protein